MCWVCTPVPGSTKFKEWFTVRCWRPNCCWMPWYARHWSEWMMLPGRITFWMIGRRVAASRLLTIRKYPVAGVVLVSTIPKTHWFRCGARPRWYLVLWRKQLSSISQMMPAPVASSHNRCTDRTKKQYTSTFRNFVPNLPVSAILVLPVFSRIFQYLQYCYNQYFPDSSSICNTHILAMTGIF